MKPVLSSKSLFKAALRVWDGFRSIHTEVLSICAAISILSLPGSSFGQTATLTFDDNGNQVTQQSANLATPTITAQPVAKVVASDGSVSFSVSVLSSVPVTYQWQLNGMNISGATGDTLFLPSAALANEGNYTVVITYGQNQTIISTPVTLTVTTQEIAAWGHNEAGELSFPRVMEHVVGIAAGEDHGLAVLENGTVTGWGDDSQGQIDIPSGLNSAVAVAAGGYQSLALLANGTVVQWGSVAVSQAPVPAGLSNVVAIAAGTVHGVALLADGTVTAWGENNTGQVTVPVGLNDVVALAAGALHTLALKADGTVVAWGENEDGQTNVPAGLSGVVAIGAGANHSLAVLSNGTVVAWGDNTFGQTTVPAGLSNVVSVTGGDFYSAALLANGTVVTWGDDGTLLATPPPNLSNVLAIAGGGQFMFALLGTDPRIQAPVIINPPDADGGVNAAFEYQVEAKNGPTSFAATGLPPGLSINGTTGLITGTPTTAGVYTATITVKNGSGTTQTTLTININLPVPVLTSGSTLVVYSNAPFSSQLTASNSPTSFSATGLPAGLTLSNSGVLSGTATAAVGSYTANVTIGNAATTNTVPLTLNIQRVIGWGGPAQFGELTVPQGLGNVVAVAAGSFLTLALNADGSIVQWGASGIAPPAGLDNVAAIAAGDAFALALLPDGTVTAWGDNSSGQSSPPTGLNDVVAIAAGSNFSLALLANGTVVQWGAIAESQTPVPAGLSNVVAISAGYDHCLALLANGTVVAWGNDDEGQTNIPAGLSNVVAIAAGSEFSLALLSDGTVTGWGSGYGVSPIPVGLANVVAISAGATSLALEADGTVVAWGNEFESAPTLPAGLSNVVAISAGPGFFFALLSPQLPTAKPVVLNTPFVLAGEGSPFSDPIIAENHPTSFSANGLPAGLTIDSGTGIISGTPTVAGSSPVTIFATNGAGTSQADMTLTVNVPLPIFTSAGAVSAAAGEAFSLQLAASNSPTSFTATGLPPGLTISATGLISGTPTGVGNYAVTITATNNFGTTQSTLTINTQMVVAWGDDGAGEIDVPANLSNVVAIAGGGSFSLALLANGTVTGWGDNTFGETSIPGMNNVVAIAAGSNFGLALMADGTVTGWGGPSGGGGEEELPAGARASSPATTIPPGLSNVVAIAAGDAFSLALQVNGTVVGWGADFDGETTIPSGLSNVVAIAAGSDFSIALKSDGTVVGWGGNSVGESTIPAGLNNVVAIAAGDFHGLALKSDGTVVGWGENFFGQTTIPAGLSNVVAIAAGTGFSLALRSDGTVLGWGDNTFGETTIPSGLNNVAAISAGSDFSLALLTGQPATTKPVILNSPFALAAPGSTFSYPVRALNKPTSFSATGLPAGLSINASTGVVSGNPTAATGTYPVTLSAKNSAGTGTLTLQLTLLPSTETTLSKLVLSSGSLSPVFSSATTGYSATVSNATSSLTVTPTVTQPQEVATVNGTVVPSGVASGAVSLALGLNTIVITVTAQDGVTTNTYTVLVTRAELPTVTTGEVTGVLSNAATFNGTVNANGANTTVSFQYGLTTSYGSTVAATPATVTDSSDTAVSATVANLLPSTTYHYRVQGINAAGTAEGGDATFTTSAFAATLSGLKVSSGTLSPAFTSATTSYAVSVPAAVSSITMTPTASAGNNAAISVNGVTVTSGSASLPVSLSSGANAIPVMVTASGAVTTYTVTVARQTAPVVVTLAQTAVTATGATLNGTVNAAGASTTVSFDYGLTTNYGSTKAATPASVTGTTTTAVKAALTGLAVGGTYHYRIRGVSANGTSLGGDMMFTTPSNVATLSGLTVSSGALSPVFSSATITYTTTASNATDSVTLTPTVGNANATVTVNGTSVPSGSASGAISLNAGPNVIKVVVTAQDGLTTKTYTVTVTRTAMLATVTTTAATGIGATGATFTGSVNPNNGTTTASFDYGTSTSYGSNIAAAQSPVSGNAATLVSASVVNLKPGTLYHYRTKGVNAAGTSPGNDVTFMTLSNVATLSSLVLNGGTLSPAFNSATTSYTANVPVTTTSVTVKPTVTQAQATVTVNGNATTSGTASGAIALSLGPNVITVAVTAQDGATVKTYTLVVTQAAAASVTTLAATNVEATTATVNATVNAEGASTAVTFNYGTSISYGSTATASPSSVTGGTATAVSAALSGLKPATLYHYRVKAVNVDGTVNGGDLTFMTLSNVATLSGLSLSSGTLSPAFASATVNYTATVSSSVTSVTVKPTVTAGSGATVQVNGNIVTSGTSSGAISISSGANVITVAVTAPDGTLKTYTVTVVQPEAPTVVTGAVPNSLATTVTLNGTVNANGTNTTASFVYGKTSSYGSTMAATPATVTGETVTAVSAKLTGLAPSTLYHYELKGVSTAGTSTGGDATFMTPSNVATLSGLVVSGATLNPAFSSTTTSYKATVSNTTPTVTLTPTVTNANAILSVSGMAVASGTPIGEILNAGVNTFTVMVTSQDGTTTKSYTVAVTRTALPATMNTELATGVGTTVATLNGTAVANNATTTLSFDYGTSTSYGHNVMATPSTTSGTTTTNLSAGLTGLLPGTTYHYRAKGVNTAGTATGGDNTFTTFSNVATLSGLKLSIGTLSPAFSSNTTAYTVTLPNGTTSMTVTPAVTNNSHATVMVNGTTVVSGAASAPLTLAPGLNVIAIAVTAQDGSTMINYTVNVTRTTPPPVVVTLGATGLSTSGATLSGTVNASGTSTTPAFDYGLTTAYGNTIATTPSTVTGTTVTSVGATIGGLSPGTTYHYRVNAVNAGGLSSGLDATFTTISNVATLSNLVLSTGAMDQSFAPATTSYTQTVSFNTSSLTVTPTVTAGSHATVQVDGNAVASGAASAPLPLSPGPNTITVLVTAQDGVTQDTYTVTVTVPIESEQPKGQNVAALPATVSAPVPIKAQLTGPVANGGVLPGAATAFAWNVGRGVSEYWLSVGSTVGGKDFYDGSQGQSLGRTVTLLTDGEDVYVTLQSLISGAWRANNYVFTTANTTAKAALTGPVANGGVLPNGAVTFTWNAGSGASEYWLSVGSTAGGTDFYDGDQSLALSRTVTLPTGGEAVYVTLRSMINGLWLANSYTFSAADTTKAVLTAPANGSALPGALTVFTWDAVPGAATYWLSIGSTAGGTDLYDASQGTALTQNVMLPTDGRALFVTLKTSINGQWQASTSTLTASGGTATIATQPTAPAAPVTTTETPLPLPASPASGSSAPTAAAELTSPADGAVLSGNPVTFTWKAGTGASEYWLSVGSSTIATDLYSASQGSNLKVTIAVPTDGSPLYVTISSLIDGQWQSNQYLYQAALPP